MIQEKDILSREIEWRGAIYVFNSTYSKQADSSTLEIEWTLIPLALILLPRSYYHRVSNSTIITGIIVSINRITWAIKYLQIIEVARFVQRDFINRPFNDRMNDTALKSQITLFTTIVRDWRVYKKIRKFTSS